MKRITQATAAVVLLLTLAAKSFANPMAVYWQTVRSTVWIVNQHGGSGSGALIDRDRRLIITNKHVVGSDSSVLVFFPDYNSRRQLIVNRSHYVSASNRSSLISSHRLLAGRVIAVSSVYDLAILQVGALPYDAQPLRLAGESAGTGEELHVVGHPANRHLWRYALGKVAAVGHRSWTYSDGQHVSTKAVTFYSSIWGGNSGGPVVNDRGELVAVVAATNPSNPMVASAIDVSSVRAVLNSLKWYRVFSVTNRTNSVVRFQIRWNSSDPWKTYEVQPGRVRWFWTTNNAAPQIRFDYSYADGFQERSYTLTYYAVLRGYRPGAADAKPYVFQPAGYGLDLYRKS